MELCVAQIVPRRPDSIPFPGTAKLKVSTTTTTINRDKRTLDRSAHRHRNRWLEATKVRLHERKQVIV